MFPPWEESRAGAGGARRQTMSGNISASQELMGGNVPLRRLKAPGQRLSTERDRPCEQGRQHRARGQMVRDGSHASRPPVWGVFNPAPHPRSHTQRNAAAGKTSAGRHRSPSPTRHPHSATPQAASTQPREENQKRQPENEPGEMLLGSFPPRWAGDRREPPARSAPRALRCRRRAMKLQRLSFRCSTEHKNPARETGKGKAGGDWEGGGEERGPHSPAAPATPFPRRGRGARGLTANQRVSISEEFLGK